MISVKGIKMSSAAWLEQDFGLSNVLSLVFVIATAGSLKRPRMAFIASRKEVGQTSHNFARFSILVPLK